MMSNFYTSLEWLKLREEILSLFGSVCMKCSSEKNIHVDHIYPVSLHPHLRLEISNLQILCETCNMEKSNLNTNDFRELAPDVNSEYDPDYYPLSKNDFFEIINEYTRLTPLDKDVDLFYRREKFYASLIAAKLPCLLNRFIYQHPNFSWNIKRKYLDLNGFPKTHFMALLRYDHTTIEDFFGLTDNCVRGALVNAYGGISQESALYAAIRTYFKDWDFATDYRHTENSDTLKNKSNNKTPYI